MAFTMFFLNCPFFAHENRKKTASKVAHNRPNFQYSQPVQNQLKSHILFHKNGSPHNFFICNDFDNHLLCQEKSFLQSKTGTTKGQLISKQDCRAITSP